MFLGEKRNFFSFKHKAGFLIFEGGLESVVSRNQSLVPGLLEGGAFLTELGLLPWEVKSMWYHPLSEATHTRTSVPFMLHYK